MTLKVWPCILLVVLSLACRSRQRTAQIATEPPEVKVSLLHMNDSDKKKDFVFRIRNCGEEKEALGERIANEDAVNFFIPGIKPEDHCALRVEYPQAKLDKIAFKGEKFVMYEAPDVKITQDIRGQLVGTAVLSKTYFMTLPTDSTERYTVQIPVEFPDKPSEASTLEGSLRCTPDIFEYANSYRKDGQSATKGEFTTGIIFQKGLANAHTCKWFHVFQKNKKVYTAKLGGDAGLLLKGVVGTTIKISAQAIKLEKVNDLEATGIIVTTEAGECKPGQKFNIEKRECQ